VFRSETWLWLGFFAAVGTVLVFLYPDSYQQDGGYHFLFARSAWAHPRVFIEVWPRPLYTLLYSFPALVGYPAAKLFTVLLSLITAYQTYRVAGEAGMPAPTMAIPLLFLQPSFFLLSADTMTETLFALVFIVALRLHLNRRTAAGMLVASLMVLARPEGFFLGILWGIWVLLDSRQETSRLARLPSTLLLASGAALWWLAAFLLTGDPLFIRDNWPANWGATQASYGTGSILTYLFKLPEIVGPLLMVLFAVGIVWLARRRRMGAVLSAFLTIFVLHSVFRVYGFFGAAGYARYLVCVSPAIALITLAGWNEFVVWAGRLPRPVGRAMAVAVVIVSFVFAVSYVDSMYFIRDASAVADMRSWFEDNPRPVAQLIWSQAYMCILLDCDIADKFPLTSDKQTNLKLLKDAPPGTLVFWDGETGPSWYGIQAADIENIGYARLRSKSYELEGRLLKRWWFHDWGTRPQEMHLLYKER